jgi:hypothetical protein
MVDGVRQIGRGVEVFENEPFTLRFAHEPGRGAAALAR